MSQPARFCIRCGAAIPVADSRFCFSCGAEIVAPAAAPPPSSNLGTEPQSGAIDPIQALQSGFIRFFDFNGRSSRSEFWWFYLFLGTVFLLTILVDALIGVVAFSFVGLLLQLAIISVAVRRLNAYIYQHQYEEAGGSSPLTPTIFSLYIVTRMTVLTIISPFRKF